METVIVEHVHLFRGEDPIRDFQVKSCLASIMFTLIGYITCTSRIAGVGFKSATTDLEKIHGSKNWLH